VHEVEQLLDAVLVFPSLASLDFIGAVLEVLGRLDAFSVLALLPDGRCRLRT
jgi:hypothetical protein